MNASPRLVALALWLAAGVLIFGRGVDRSLNHDDHQFVVPGALLSREGLLPYRDYPLFHLPNLVFAYAALDRLTGSPLLAAKLFSCAATWLAVGAILWIVFSASRLSLLARAAIGASLLVLLLHNPIFLYTAGKTWNHEVPASLLIFAVIFHLAARRHDSLPLIGLSGLAVGLAVGTRLTFAPCLLPLVGLTLFFPGDRTRRGKMAAVFTLAATAALGPSLYFLATSPEAFIFGNLEFPRLRLLDPENIRIQKTMTVWRKLRYFAKEILLPSWPVVVPFLLLTIRPLRRRLGITADDIAPARLVALVAAFLVLGCFLPSRYQYQHFFALVPLLILGSAFAVTALGEAGKSSVLVPAAFLSLAVTSCLIAAYNPGTASKVRLPGARELINPQAWFTARAARFGAEIRSHVPAGRILTLAPIWPLAGGLQVYPEFATGPFAWRSASFVAPERRARLHLVAPADLEPFLGSHPPAAILTAVETRDLEAPIIAYAEKHGFRMIKLSRKRDLWLPPAEPTPTP